MDLSKLPKLSQTSAHVPPPDAPGAAPTVGDTSSTAMSTESPALAYQNQPVYRGAPAGPEAFVSIAIGVILLFLNTRLITYLAGGNIGTFTDENQQPMRYLDTVFFQGDAVIVAFALVLIVEGLIIAFVRNATLVLAATVFTALATLANLVYLIMTYRTYGFALLSAFAVAFGIYITMSEWRTYQALKK